MSWYDSEASYINSYLLVLDLNLVVELWLSHYLNTSFSMILKSARALAVEFLCFFKGIFKDFVLKKKKCFRVEGRNCYLRSNLGEVGNQCMEVMGERGLWDKQSDLDQAHLLKDVYWMPSMSPSSCWEPDCTTWQSPWRCLHFIKNYPKHYFRVYILQSENMQS